LIWISRIITISIFLHMPTEKSKDLRKNREESLDKHEKDNEYLKKSENAYIEVAKRYNMHTIECVSDNRIKTIYEISDDVYNYIINKL